MNRRSHNLRVVFALSCIFGLAQAACADEDNNSGPMEIVVFTPTRTKTSLSDAPAAVTVVTAKDIKAKNVSRLGDVLDQVPSLYLRDGAFGQSQGTSGTSGMSLRGVDQSRTLILLDGQPLQDARSGKVNWQVPFIDDIARVEVVPGAFSSLYGSNAIGGVINIITKQPDRNEFTAKIKKGWGDAGSEEASIYFRNKMDNGLGFVGGLGYQNHNSYVNDFVVKTPVAGAPGPIVVTGAQPITTRDGVPAYRIGDKGTTPWHSANATAKLFYNLSNQARIYTGILYEESNEGYTRFNTYLRDTTTGAPVSSGTLDINGQRVALTESNFVNNSPLHEAATRYFVGYDGTLGNDYSLKVDFAQIKRVYSFTFANSTATWSSGSGSLYDTPNTGLDGTAQLTFPLGTRQILVTGVTLHNDTANQKIYTLTDWRNPDAKTAVTGSYNGDSTTTSIFAQDEISAADVLKVYFGGRLDHWQTKGDSTAATTTIYPSRSATAFSPKLSAVYKATEATTLRASFGRSLRAPTNEDMYTTTILGPTTYAGDPNLQPERGSTWEAGGEHRITEKTKVTATYYETRLSNLIYSQQTAILNTKLKINAGKALIRGIELSVTSRLTDWLDLDANYAFIDSTMLENLSDPGSVGKRLTDSPKNIAGIVLTAQQGAWSGTLNVRYVSHSYFTAHNTDVVEGVPGSYDAHTIVNTKLGYEFAKGVKGIVAINNLLDSKAYSYFLLPGRNVTAEMDFSF